MSNEVPGSGSVRSVSAGVVDFRTRSGRGAPVPSPGAPDSDETGSGGVLDWHGVTYLERDGLWWRIGEPPPRPVPPGDPDDVLDLVSAAGSGRRMVETQAGQDEGTRSRYAVMIDLAAAAANSPRPSGGVAGAIRRLNGVDVLPAEVWLDGHGRLVRFAYVDPTMSGSVTVEYEGFGCLADIAPPARASRGSSLGERWRGTGWRAVGSGRSGPLMFDKFTEAARPRRGVGSELDS
jgi:hypothetical protein